MSYSGLGDAYVAQLDDLLSRPRFRNAPRGFPSAEVIGVRFEITDPRRRLLPCAARRSNIVFNFAEALWYLSGRDDLEYLSYYAPGVRRFVSGASSLTGTAYGPRIFRFGETGLDQWASVVETLRSDPDSKRAVVQIFQPEELAVRDNPDVACTIALQFLAREGRLHAVGYMRANDAFRGIVSDVFSFTLLQEFMARHLGLALGEYVHVVGSLHLYEPDEAAARRVVAAGRTAVDDRMPPMPAGDQRGDLDRLMVLEERLRRDTLRITPDDVDRLPLADYWRHVAVLFELYRTVRHGGGRETAALAARLPATYRWMALNRFPSLVPDLITAEATA